ncbi:MAG: phosphoribosylanthranilate isomerase, partial [Bacteroidota bacterium]
MKLKVCGMKHNPEAVAALQPDYLGFIFWEKSARFFEGEMPQLPKSIKKVGVFVDASWEKVMETIERFGLDAVQLHGQETPEFCDLIRKQFSNISDVTLSGVEMSSHSEAKSLEIIKVFSIKDDFDFSLLEPYEDICDYFLFDTKGKLPGGNGYAFNWKILENYPSTKPYFLSGGIGLENQEDLKSFLKTNAAQYCHAIDINSKFELQPGHKNIEAVKEFKKFLTEMNQRKK